MIIKGKSRGRGAALGVYLQNQERNERATVLEVSGTIAQDATGALKEMEAYAEGTKCTLPLYHAQINPEPPYQLTREQMYESVDLLEKELGLTGQPRVIVAHEKDGREHFHVVWARIDLEKGKAIPDSHNFPAHEKVSRELERRFDHPRVQGAHAERDGEERPERSPTRAEIRQEQRTGIKGKDVREDVTELFHLSAGPEEFREALDEHGYVLAKGDKRGFVIVDRAGGIHSLARRIEGMKAAELRAFMAPLDRESLPSVEEAKLIAEDRQHGGSAYDQQCWDDALAASAIDADKAAQHNHDAAAAHEIREQRKDQAESRPVIEWEDQLAAAAIKKVREDEAEERKRKRAAHADAKMEAAYGKSEDYVSQTLAARKDNENRQEMLAQGPQHPESHPRTERKFDKAERQIAARQNRSDLSGAGIDAAIGEDWEPTAINHVGIGLVEPGQQPIEHSEQDAPIGEERAATAINHTGVNRSQTGPAITEPREQRAQDAAIGDLRTKTAANHTGLDRFDSVEMTDAQRARMERLLDSGDRQPREHDDDDPDRQREAPGGGRTRSR